MSGDTFFKVYLFSVSLVSIVGAHVSGFNPISQYHDQKEDEVEYDDGWGEDDE